MGVWTWRLSKNRNQNIIVSASALLAIVAIPLFYYRFVYYQTHLADIYRTALPAFTVQEDYPAFYYPYYLLAVCFLAFVVCYNNNYWQHLSPASGTTGIRMPTSTTN